MKPTIIGIFLRACVIGGLLAAGTMPASAQDLAEIRERGVIRHLGVPYARFITGNGEGFDADLVRRFAAAVFFLKKDVAGKVQGFEIRFKNILIGNDQVPCPQVKIRSKVPARIIRVNRRFQLLFNHVDTPFCWLMDSSPLV